jgi:hypothetical protein
MIVKKPKFFEILKNFSWQDGISIFFLLSAGVFLMAFGMVCVGSEGVLIIVGAVCLIFAIRLFNLNGETMLLDRFQSKRYRPEKQQDLEDAPP